MGKNVYIRGVQLLKLDVSEVDPACKFLRTNPAEGLEHVNLAFRLLWQGRQNIAKCTDTRLRKRMTEQLEEDLRAGWDDMYDACDYVYRRLGHKHKYLWSDDFGTTSGVLEGFNCKTGPTTVWKVQGAYRAWPDPIWNFRKAIQKRGSMQNDLSIKKFVPQTAKIVDGFDKSAFNGMSALLASWRADMDRLDKFAWILDPSEEESFQFATGKKRLSYTKSLSRLENVLTQAAKYRDADFDNRTSVAFALLTEAVDFIPVFGTFYGKMLKPLPGFFATFRLFFQTRLRRQLNP